MTEQTRYYYAEVHILISADDSLLTYYSDASMSPEDALRSAKALALAEHPGKTVVGHRTWAAHD